MNRKPVIPCCHLAGFLHSPLSASPTDPSKDKFSRRETKSIGRFLEWGLYESRKPDMQLMAARERNIKPILVKTAKVCNKFETVDG